MYGHSEGQAVGFCVAERGQIHKMNLVRQLQTAVFRQEEPLQDWYTQANEPKRKWRCEKNGRDKRANQTIKERDPEMGRNRLTTCFECLLPCATPTKWAMEASSFYLYQYGKSCRRKYTIVCSTSSAHTNLSSVDLNLTDLIVTFPDQSHRTGQAPKRWL